MNLPLPSISRTERRRGVTLIELMVVIVILSILSTIAVGVYSREIERSRVAAARAEIHALEVAINRYEIDNGQYPLTGSGTGYVGSGAVAILEEGSGYAQLSLRASLNADQASPLSQLWNGPYLEWDENDLGTLTGAAPTSPAQLNWLDPWGNPYFYVRNNEYGDLLNGNALGTLLPAGNPYAGTEVYHNVSTFQLYSLGPDGVTLGPGQQGTDVDDIANWEGPKL